MTLERALAVAKQQIDPEYKGAKFPLSGIYRAANGQYMTGPSSYSPHRTWWTFEQFVAEHQG